ncbi:hypothetical protein C900_00756 [Fulvivirga imtechensis AK7]|uniref:Uncharacterized protein n=1 Tax=Fulvivirga imtechensis AK7 TaxID=1237149 RepID=L8JVI4_9BACT|nr:hypothetical protein C900_00756 [Fulvivirga imtechensis AK7]
MASANGFGRQRNTISSRPFRQLSLSMKSTKKLLATSE